MTLPGGIPAAAEWLLTNRLGSFAMGSADGVPRRKYHGWLIVREPGQGESLHALAALGETVRYQGQTHLLYGFSHGDAIAPRGFEEIEAFDALPVPRWRYRIGDARFDRTITLDAEADRLTVTYAFTGMEGPAELWLQPFLTFRPMHHLTFENMVLHGGVQAAGGAYRIAPYEGLPALEMRIDGLPHEWEAGGWWHTGIHYAEEESRGYDADEDYFSPGAFRIAIPGDCTLSFHAAVGVSAGEALPPRPFSDPLERAADQFLVRRKDEFVSIIAGYPWFGEWGRDTFIALPGLCLATGRIDHATAILESYGNHLERGLVPNLPATSGAPANLNSADASLLYVRCVQALAEWAGPAAALPFRAYVFGIVDAILGGADPRVKVTRTGELWVEPGAYALTWMDAIVDGEPVTPRHGYAVDLNALWYNALGFAAELARSTDDHPRADRLAALFSSVGATFVQRFWLPERGFLADGHDGLQADESLRPNQLWATALPFSPVPREMAASIIARVRADLLTPAGLRTLSPHDPRYRGRYSGGQYERDTAYHQGSVWPWLLGIYADSIDRTEGREALRFELAPIIAWLRRHLESEACLGSISEVFDGDSPHHPGGAPAQAWSVAEVLRIAKKVLD